MTQLHIHPFFIISDIWHNFLAIENLKKITIELENGLLPNGKFCEIINSDSFTKWDDGTPIPETKQKEILKNFTEAMELQGIGVVVE